MAVGHVIPGLILLFTFSLVFNKHKTPSDFEKYHGQSIFDPVEYFCSEIYSLPWDGYDSHLGFKTNTRRRVYLKLSEDGEKPNCCQI